jgi:hypothetical protein
MQAGAGLSQKIQGVQPSFPENTLTFIPSSDPWRWTENNDHRPNSGEPRTTQEKSINRNLRQYGSDKNDQLDPMDNYYSPINQTGLVTTLQTLDKITKRKQTDPPIRPTAADYL